MRIEKPDSIVSVYAYRPLEVAVETATIQLIDWLVERLRIQTGRCLLPGKYMSGLSDQCVSDVQDRKLSYVAGAEIRRGIYLRNFYLANKKFQMHALETLRCEWTTQMPDRRSM